MRRLFFVLFLIAVTLVSANDSIQFEQLRKEIVIIQGSNILLQVENRALKRSLLFTNERLDSLQEKVLSNEGYLKQVEKNMHDDIQMTQEVIDLNKDELNKDVRSKVVIGIICVIFILSVCAIIYFILHKRMLQGSSVIGKIQETQKTLQEESVKLDNRLMEILNKQLSIQQSANAINNVSKEIDHSLALKIADEIARIETNLSRMDASVRGYKQLSASVRRMKDNFLANGYEMIDMLEKTYNEGMRVIPEFIFNEELKEGERIITSVIKPQVNYKGQIIQKAKITVTQNI